MYAKWLVVTTALSILLTASAQTESAQATKGFAWMVRLHRIDSPDRLSTIIEASSSYAVNVQVVPLDDTSTQALAEKGAFVTVFSDDLASEAKIALEGGRSTLHRRVILIHEPTYFRTPDEISLELRLDARKISFHLGSAIDSAEQIGPVSLAPIEFRIKTESAQHASTPLPPGRGYLGLVAFDENFERVSAEASFSVCTAELSKAKTQDCDRLKPIAFGLSGRDPLRDGGPETKSNLYGMPNAAVTLIQPEENAELFGVFRVNQDAREINGPVPTQVWSLRPQTMADVIKNIQSIQLRFGRQESYASGVGEDMFRVLFPPNASRAREAFQAFVAATAPHDIPYSQGNLPSLSIRFLAPATVGPPPKLFPMGSIWVPVVRSSAVTLEQRTAMEGRGLFLGQHFRIETPLRYQRTQETQPCISDWRLVGPPESGDAALTLARSQLSTDQIETDVSGREAAFLGVDNPSAPLWSMRAFRQWITADKTFEGPLALSIVSHHDSNRVYFSSDHDDGFAAFEIAARIAKPSFAILSACSTGSMEPIETQMIESLNDRGFEAFVATTAPISGELAGLFSECVLRTLRERRGLMNLAELFSASRRCIFDRGGQLDMDILKFVFLGNSALAVCPPTEK